MIIVTNNALVYETYHQKIEIKYLEHHTFLQVLEYCRDEIHLGAQILTHPLTGSVKPNETPFKSIMLEIKKGPLDVDSLTLISNAIEVTTKFLNNHQVKDWPQKILDDFKVIDYGLITSAIQSIY